MGGMTMKMLELHHYQDENGNNTWSISKLPRDITVNYLGVENFPLPKNIRQDGEKLFDRDEIRYWVINGAVSPLLASDQTWRTIYELEKW
jgi:hypothetical protein